MTHPELKTERQEIRLTKKQKANLKRKANDDGLSVTECIVTRMELNEGAKWNYT